MALASNDSFGNAEAVHLALGWEVIKGFVVFELGDQPEGEAFVAHKRWWNAKPNTGVWVDLTPRPEGVLQMVLLESARCNRRTPTRTAPCCSCCFGCR